MSALHSSWHIRFKDGVRKGPDSRTMIRVLLYEILWKSFDLSVFAGKYSFTLACRWFDFARDSRWSNVNRTSFAKDSMTSCSYPNQAEACSSVLKWIVVLKMSLILNQIQELHWRLNVSSVWRSVFGLWKRGIWVKLVNQVKAYVTKTPYLNVRAPALLFLRWSKFLIFHKIIVSKYTRLAFTKTWVIILKVWTKVGNLRGTDAFLFQAARIFQGWL